MRFLLVLSSGTAFLGACSAPQGPPLVVRVEGEDSECRVYLGGERVSSDQLLSRAAKQAGIAEEAVVIGAGTTPYRCIGGAVFTLQRAGFARARFQLEP